MSATAITPLVFTETVAAGPDAVDFGLTDERGRTIGYVSGIYRRTYSARTDGFTWGVQPGGLHQDGATIYRGWTWATRDGESYGAAQRDVFGATLEEVQSALNARRESARARYANKASR